MDNRNEIRDFLTSRRARITPEHAGLPVYGGNRHVAGLRREEVALLAGVSIDYYTRLERGKATGVSEGVLEGLAPRCNSAPTCSTWSARRTPRPGHGAARPASRSARASSASSTR